ncbi:MAG TPA: pitrilysin family protein [Candidatus Paceibacterota bacterium]|nr:pitrilysin family protein [Candidatus Paceibacterota bacterium]
MKHHIHTLPNGLRAVLIPMDGAETATVIVMTGTGSRYENEHENGLAHFLEHMFFKGTKKRRNARAISEELDAVGSVSNAFTSKERTAYYAKVSSQYLDTALDVISDIFLHSTLPSREITKERGAILQEIDMYEDMPMRDIYTVFEALIFDGNTLSRTILGPKENIRSFTRKDFDTYLKRNYTPGNTVVCIAGSFNQSKVLAKIKKEFGHLKPAPLPEFAPFVSGQESPRVMIKEKKTDQTQLVLGVPAYPYKHKDEYALEVLTTLLGSGMSSRLFMEVREKRGLAYSVHAWSDHYPDTGYFAVQAGVEHGKLEKALMTVLAELRKIKRTRVSPQELAKAKAYLIGTMTLMLETSDRVAENAASSIINLGEVRTLEEMIKHIKAVTAADIERVARDIFKTEKLNLAVIGPHTDEARLRSLLKI